MTLNLSRKKRQETVELDIKRLQPTIGAEISGIDISRSISDAMRDAIRAAVQELDQDVQSHRQSEREKPLGVLGELQRQSGVQLHAHAVKSAR